MKDGIKGSELDLTINKGVIEGRVGNTLAVVANVNEKLEITTIVYKTKGLDKDDVVATVQEYAKENMTLAQVKTTSIPVKGAKVEKKAAVAAPKAKAPSAKKDPGRDITGMKKVASIDLTTIKDVPSSLKEWTKKCGGVGYCLGGSGLPVRRNFTPGFDAKLKSVLKKLGTKNAKALAGELGWADMIKWG